MPKLKQSKIIACYVRVSTTSQNEAGQRREIQRWLTGNGIDPKHVRWFIDKQTGDNLKRPAFEELQRAIFNGEIGTVVVYKLDRLSRKQRDGINVLCDWCDRGLRMVSTTQQIDFTGTVGRMIASVLFAVAEMEQETRRERVASGIAAAKANGKKWGGSKPGRKKVDATKERTIRKMKEAGAPIAAIARTVGLSRPTIYDVLRTP